MSQSPHCRSEVSLFDLDKKLFTRNFRSAEKGAAGCASGMTTKKSQTGCCTERHRTAVQGGGAPRASSDPTGCRGHREVGLSKPGGGVRGIVADEVVRRVVARTVAQQLGPAVEAARTPCQFALSTRAGCECAAPALQFLTQAGPEATNTSVDGVGAFDLVSAERCCKVWPG